MKEPRTVARYLYDEWRAGRIQLHEAAREFHAHGWTNFVDVDYTARMFGKMAMTQTAAASHRATLM